MLKLASPTQLARRLAGLAILAGWSVPAAAQSPDRFETEIKPILEQSCLPCHGPERRMSGLSVTSVEDLLIGGARHGAAVTPGHPERSPLVQALEGKLTPRMPMGKPALSDELIEPIAAWIRTYEPAVRSSADGAWNPFQGPRRPLPPDVADEAWVRNPIDRFILAALEEKGLKPSPEADRRTLLRRVTFDLAGEPPTPQEVEAFLADDQPRAYERLIDRLLADPRYGERWGRHWLDLARYADSMGLRPTASSITCGATATT